MKTTDRQIPAHVLEKEGTVLLESQLQGPESLTSWLFNDPVEVIICSEPGQVKAAIQAARQKLREGFALAGFVSYEAGLPLMPHQEAPPADGFPLLWLGVYDRAESIKGPLALPPPPLAALPIDPELDVDRQRFTGDVEKILHYIRSGDTYQVNYTCRAHFPRTLSPLEMYLHLRRFQQVPYGALLNCGDISVVSQSPELFLKREGNIIISRPMKGTARRGEDPDEDEALASWLGRDDKNRAENLMITDLMRNDLGQLAVRGSVEVFDTFRVEGYRTVHQMTSGVRCRVNSSISSMDILEATFPPGSITGAPKVRTMQIIGELEESPRRVYTGVIGAFFPSGDMTTNVAIRTIIMERGQRCEIGIGSGIVSDSVPGDEYEETLLKASFLNPPAASAPELLETMLLDGKGEIPLLDRHLARMENSAKFLGHPFSKNDQSKRLLKWLEPVAGGPFTVRMRSDHLGRSTFELLPLPATDAGLARLLVSGESTDSTDPLYQHKTTNRPLYDREFARAASLGFHDILFCNRDGHLTEGAITNLFIFSGGSWQTPPVADGLLPGLWREAYLAETGARELSLTLEDVKSADRIILGNSVRGAMEVGEIVSANDTVLWKSP
jgi:para-aminobenzoate synthetase/4-amino-4-deoxychorismate lyase